MAAISNTLTWTIVPNQLVTGDGTQAGGADDWPNAAKQLFLDIKNVLVANGWTVMGSSDGTTGAMDSTDRWSTISDLLGASITGGPAPHSWIVLLSPSGMYVKLSQAHDNAAGSRWKFMFFSISENNYTGGDNQNDPTSVNEGPMKVGLGFHTDAWINADVTNNIRWHFWQSTTGRNTRIAIYIDNNLESCWLFEELKNPQTGWNTPWMVGISAANVTDSANDLRHFWRFDEIFYRTYHADGEPNLRVYWSTFCFSFSGSPAENFIFTEQISAAHPVTGEVTAFEYYIFSNEGGRFTRLGELYDFRNEGVQDDGEGYPSDPGQHIHVGHKWVWPWDGASSYLTA